MYGVHEGYGMCSAGVRVIKWAVCCGVVIKWAMCCGVVIKWAVRAVWFGVIAWDRQHTYIVWVWCICTYVCMYVHGTISGTNEGGLQLTSVGAIVCAAWSS